MNATSITKHSEQRAATKQCAAAEQYAAAEQCATTQSHSKAGPMMGKSFKTLAAAFLGAVTVLGAGQEASAQEILLTGPLAGAPACRGCRMYREGRFEIAPSISFTLLDEYQRLILVGGRLNYNITEWLAIGAWGAFSPAPLKLTTDLTDRIQDENAARQAGSPDATTQANYDTARSLTAVNMGPNFEDQLGTIDWVASPQLTLVPFRGKIGMFQSIYIDTDFYIFGGPAFVGLKERDDCIITGPGPGACAAIPGQSEVWPMASRMEIAPTFGVGFQFYMSRWAALGLEWRGLPVARNVGGFDNHGDGPGEAFPDFNVDEKDRETKFNQMITISFGVSLPFDHKVSE
jgi:hypothetical protein